MGKCKHILLTKKKTKLDQLEEKVVIFEVSSKSSFDSLN